MIYDPTKPFSEQSEEVQNYIRTEVIDQQAEPTMRDTLGRPKTFDFPFEDETGAEYNAEMTNIFISDRSWALADQRIVVTPIVK